MIAAKLRENAAWMEAGLEFYLDKHDADFEEVFDCARKCSAKADILGQLEGEARSVISSLSGNWEGKSFEKFRS